MTRRAQLTVAAAQGGDLVLQLEDPPDALEADAGRRSARDLTQQLDVAQGVAPPAAAGAAGRDQADAVVLAQGLRVQAGELGSDADRRDRHVRAGDPSRRDHVRRRPDDLASRTTLEQRGPRVGAAACVTVRRDGRPGGLIERVGHLDVDGTSRSPLRAVLARRTPATDAEHPAVGVPGGIRRVTGGPPSVGTLISAPRAASSKVTGASSVRLSPLRPKSVWA